MSYCCNMNGGWPSVIETLAQSMHYDRQYRIVSPQSVLVNGVPRHVKDLRPFSNSDPLTNSENNASAREWGRGNIGGYPRRSQSVRKKEVSVPEWHNVIPVESTVKKWKKNAPLHLLRNTRRKIPTLNCSICDQDIRGGEWRKLTYSCVVGVA